MSYALLSLFLYTVCIFSLSPCQIVVSSPQVPADSCFWFVLDALSVVVLERSTSTSLPPSCHLQLSVAVKPRGHRQVSTGILTSFSRGAYTEFSPMKNFYKEVCGGVWSAVLLQGRRAHLSGICNHASPA